MAEAELEDGVIRVIADFREKDKMDLIPGARHDPRHMNWRIPLSWAACRVLREVFGDDLEIGPALTEWAWDELNERVNPCLELRGLLDAPGDEKLYPFQRAGVKFLATARRALLADEMGTGKTVQTISALRELHARGLHPLPALIICPNSMKLTWQREFAKWWPQVNVVVIDGSAAQRRKQLNEDAHVYVINWESLRLHTRLAPYGSIALKADEKVLKELNTKGFKSVVADEAHRMKDPKAKQTRATWAVMHGDSVENVFALTGTPIANHPDDLWAMMHGVAPAEYPNRKKFIDRYCLQSWSPFGTMEIIGINPSKKAEFESIIDPRMRRMPKALVLDQLPPQVNEYRYIEMHPKQKKAYEAMKKDQLAKLEEGGMIYSVNPLTVGMRMMQFASSYAEAIETTNESGFTETEVRLAEPSNKIDELLALLEDLPEGEPLVVMAPSRQLIMLADERLRSKNYRTCLIVGGMTNDQRQRSIDDFQMGYAQIILCTVGAGGIGLTLTRAAHGVFIQLPWSMVEYKQARDRWHRIGSEIHDKVVVHHFISKGTVEEKQLVMLETKSERLEEIVRDKDALARRLATAKEKADLEEEERLLLEQARLDAEEERLLQDPLAGGKDAVRSLLGDA